MSHGATQLLDEVHAALLGATGAFNALEVIGADRNLPGFRHTLAKIEAAIKTVEAAMAAPLSETVATDSRVIRVRQRIAEWRAEDSAEHYNMLRDIEEVVLGQP